MRRALVLAAVALALAVPAVQAGLFRDDPVVVTIPALRAGDAFRATVPDATEHSREGDVVAVHAQEHVLELIGPATALDAFGIERATVALREDVLWDGALHAATRCHLLSGGADVVRTDWLAGAPPARSSSSGGSVELLGIPLGSSASSSSANRTTSFGGGCTTPFVRPGPVSEGDRVPLSQVLPFESPAPGLGPSAPATPTEFHGRPALELAYDVPATDGAGVGGRAVVVVADGLPVVARISFLGDGRATDTWTVTGFRAGEGAPLPPIGTETVPTPAAASTPYAPLALDDRAFGLEYPFAEAFANLRADPRTGLAAYLERHPEASIGVAEYQRDGGVALVPGSEGEGMWTVMLGDAGSTWLAWTSRSRLSGAAGELQPDGAKSVYNSGGAENPEGLPTWMREPPAGVVPSASLLEVAQAHGVVAAELRSVGYRAFGFQGGPPSVEWTLSTIPTGLREGRATGTAVDLDGITGGAWALYEGSAQGSSDGVLHALEIEGSDLDGAPARTSVAVLGGVPEGLGLAGGAAVAAGILVLLAKLLLVPLFTRLRRDRLLDNPVRARLYERIRADPGIHRADLVDFLGVGEGATRHHLKQLVGHRMVVELAIDGFSRYFAAGEVPPDVARRIATLRAGSLRRVYDLDLAEPGLSLRGAARRLGLSAPTVYRARARLRRSGLLAAAPARAPSLEVH